VSSLREQALRRVVEPIEMGETSAKVIEKLHANRDCIDSYDRDFGNGATSE